MRLFTAGGICIALIYSSFIKAQTCNNSIIETTPLSRFDLKADGTVIDNQTKLMWMRCSLGAAWSNGECKGAAEDYTWQQALDASYNSRFAGYNNWRVPNIKELSSIVELSCREPAINLAVFPQASNSYVWSSSPYSFANENAWRVGFQRGEVYGVSFYHSITHVRLVRTLDD